MKILPYYKDRIRENRNHEFFIIERIREDDLKRFFVQWDSHNDDEVGFSQNIMFVTKYNSITMAYDLKELRKKFPNETFVERRLVIDFEVYPVGLV